MKTLEPVIGLEIHVQLKTKSKMFCSCPNGDSGEPNTNVCSICLGHPGVLPVPNEQAVRWSILVGLALNCQINSASKFDRKHYFYPDLPKGYQISQFDLPIAENGFLEIIIPKEEREQTRIGITRVHLEEDAAKSFHDASLHTPPKTDLSSVVSGEGKSPPSSSSPSSSPSTPQKTFIDFNRAGTPLVEIVTEPDFRSAREAKIFLQELRLIARTLNVSNADMEKGELRCDVNVSLREIDKTGAVIGPLLNPKTEIKNVNSFKAVERVIEYEIQRQTKLWQTDSPPATTTTRGWNDTKQITEDQRTKEDAEDYRYLPEPDIPALDLSALIEEIKPTIPELPAAKRHRLVEEYALNFAEAKHLCDDLDLADFAEETFSEIFAWLQALPEFDDLEEEALQKEKHRLSHLASGWLVSKLGGLLSEKGLTLKTQKMNPENFAEFIIMVAQGKLSTTNGMAVLTEMTETGADPEQILEDKALNLISNEDELTTVIEKILVNYPNEIARYKAGEEKLLKFFIGQLMKETAGNANPAMSNQLFKKILNK